jgi:hypothetical protein
LQLPVEALRLDGNGQSVFSRGKVSCYRSQQLEEQDRQHHSGVLKLIRKAKMPKNEDVLARILARGLLRDILSAHSKHQTVVA